MECCASASRTNSILYQWVLDPKYILGGQANLWSERLNTVRHAEYMLWPRAFAIAESVWSPLEKKNWNNFVQRTEKHFQRFDVAGIKYSRSMYDPAFAVKRNADNTLQVTAHNRNRRSENPLYFY